jgi:hypothetical protein
VCGFDVAGAVSGVMRSVSQEVVPASDKKAATDVFACIMSQTASARPLWLHEILKLDE